MPVLPVEEGGQQKGGEARSAEHGDDCEGEPRICGWRSPLHPAGSADGQERQARF